MTDLLKLGVVERGGKFYSAKHPKALEAIQGISKPRSASGDKNHVPASNDSTTTKSEGQGDGFDSELERDYARHLSEMMIAGRILYYDREPVRVKLCKSETKRGGYWWYEPDFKVMTVSGVEWHEIKPNFTEREARIGELKLDMFANKCRPYGEKVFRVTRDQGQWTLTEVTK